VLTLPASTGRSRATGLGQDKSGWCDSLTTRLVGRAPLARAQLPAMPINPSAPLRVVVIGSSCAGKSTFARALSAATGGDHIELDELYWSQGWQPKPEAQFLRLVDAATMGKRWVAAGNYSPARQIFWNRATVIVWLDFSLPRVLLRGLVRSLRRIVGGEPLFHGNRETLGRTFFSRESILWWIVTTFHRRRREFSQVRSTGGFRHLTWLHARTPDEAQGILESLARTDR
jgi:adenylate kinase family enzyme